MAQPDQPPDSAPADPNDPFVAAIAERYRIERTLGAGGMATVYLAEDVKHRRRVAIKVLHPELSAVLGPERFIKEIELTANLQHPHILPLFDSGSANGLLYYVMPYVEGETLRARLEREGQLPVEDALRIASESADALHYAHQHDIVHRDIKPENILLQNGHALVADFGIALAVKQAGGQRMTQTGLSLGTPQYMAPEQAMGDKHVDARADTYALGAVTYEMLAGQPPFTGPNGQTIIAKVITEKAPPLRALRPAVSPAVAAAVARALEKLPADRWQATERFAEALTRPITAGATGNAAETDNLVAQAHVGGLSARGLVATVIGAAIAAGLIAAGGWWFGHRSTAQTAPWSEFTQLTDASGVETDPSLSPDGESFAYASNSRGTWDIYVQRVGGRNPVIIAGDSTADEQWPAYSPDGHDIAYAKNGNGIFIVGATGESPRRLTDFGSNPAWSPDGHSVVFGSEAVLTPYAVTNTGHLWVVNASGGAPRQLDPKLPGYLYQPAWSPSGKRIAFWIVNGGQRDIATMAASGGAGVLLTNDAAVDWAPTWSPDGRYIYFGSDRGGTMGIWRIAVDESSGHARGVPEPVVAGADGAMGLPHLSPDGNTLVFSSTQQSVNPAAISLDPTGTRVAGVKLLQDRTGSLVPTDASADGKWLALYNRLERQQDIFIMRTDGSDLTRLTDDAARDWSPMFTGDSSEVTFYSNSGGKYDAWLIHRDGSGRTRLSDLKGGAEHTVLSPDGKRLLVTDGSDPDRSFEAGPPWPVTDRTATVVPNLAVPHGFAQFNTSTKDGRWVGGVVVTSGGAMRGHVVADPTTLRPRVLNDDSGGAFMAWLPDDQHVIYFMKDNSLVVQDISTLARHGITGKLPYPPEQSQDIVASPDGHTLYYGAERAEANIWMVRRAGTKSTNH